MSKGKLLAVVVVWLILFGIAAVAWRYIVRPKQQEAAQQQNEERLQNGSSASRYKHRLNLALDSFSGYAILRSEPFANHLSERGIKLNLHDDQANYTLRLQKLQSGETDMAVFTIDALVKASSELKGLPASIVAIIDETRGADAIVAYKGKYPDVDHLNRPETRLLLTPNSPSETLARVAMKQFKLDRLSASAMERARDPQSVFQQYLEAKPDDPLVYVLWEPYVSKMLENPAVHVLIDSSRFRGYIVDVLVVNRDFLVKQRSVVQEVLECYFRAAFELRQGMVDLVLQDAKSLGETLTPEQADNLVQGVWWKNTVENFAHFGLGDTRSLLHIEDMISNIIAVTGVPDPTQGKPNLLYYDELARELHRNGFHPGVEEIREDGTKLRPLSEDEWNSLVRVGELNVPRITFARGTARLNGHSQIVLDNLAKSLSTSKYYVLLRGDASRQGNIALNAELALQRAQTAADYLINQGVDRERIRAVAGEPAGETEVTFLLGQPPY